MAEEQQENKELQNNVSVEDSGPCKKKVTVEIPEEKIKQATETQYKTLKQQAEIPGFRKGRAPRRLLEKRFGDDISQRIKLELVAEASQQAIEQNDINALREPDIKPEDLELPDSGPLKFDFEVEVKPDFELPDLENIPVKKPKQEITDDQLDHEIEQLRKYSGTWAPKKEDTVEQQDQVIADVILNVEGIEEEEKHDNAEVNVRPNGFVASVPVENLNEILEGAKEGETRETTVEVPKTFYKEEYRGKKVNIKIHVKDIKYLKPADLDENFLQRFGAENEEELRKKMREALGSRQEDQARNQMAQQVYDYLIENTDFELPTDIVAEQANTALQRQYINMLQQGQSKEQIEENLDDLRSSSEDQAKQQLKSFFIMEKIADKFDLDVTEEELNGHIAQTAMQRGQRPEKLREEMARDGSLQQFRMRIREEKAMSKLLDSAKIEEVEPSELEKEQKSGEKTTKTQQKSTKKSKKSKKSSQKNSEKSKKKTKSKAKKTTKKKTKKKSKKKKSKKKDSE